LNPHYFEFTKSYRQKEDLEFVEILDKVRRCEVDDETLSQVNQRYDPHFIPKRTDFTITLTTNNFIANEQNNRRLSELESTKYQFIADSKGDFGDNKGPTNRILELKKDAQVIFTRNDSTGQRRWVNGTIAKIEFIANDIVEVRLPDGSVHQLEKETWEHRGYKYDRSKGKVTSEVKGTFVQYPIKLAWAITIHKSQGLTFDNVIIDLGSGAFVNG
jgi:ATP-dependent exoDNAse (exonuclease V) alpha subunit